MSDILWTLATVDHDAEEHRARIEAAYMASAPLWPFLAASTSVPDYDNRRQMLADRLEMAVLGSLGTDTQHFLATLDGLDQRLAQDFTILDEQREALCKGRVGPLEAAYRRQGLSATAARAEALLAAHSSRRDALEVGANTTLTAAPRGWALLVLGHRILSYDDDTFVVHQVDAQKVPLQLVQARLNAWLPEGYTVTRDGNRLTMHRMAGGMGDPYSRGKAQDAASGGVPDPYMRKAKCHNTERSKDGTCTACGTKSDKTPHALGPWLKRSSVNRRCSCGKHFMSDGQLKAHQDKTGHAGLGASSSPDPKPKKQSAFVRIAVSWGRRHYEDLASFISQHDEPERSHLAAHFADRLIGTNPHFHPDQFRQAATTPGYIPRNGTGGADYTQGHMEHLADTVRSYPGDQHMLADHLATRLQTANPRFKRNLFMNRALGDSAPAKAASRKLSALDVLATVFTAEEHGGYHIEQDGGKWKVVNHIGEVKSTFDSHEKALEYQRALMVNVPGAKEDAERHEENGDKGKHSSLHTAKEYSLPATVVEQSHHSEGGGWNVRHVLSPTMSQNVSRHETAREADTAGYAHARSKTEEYGAPVHFYDSMGQHAILGRGPKSKQSGLNHLAYDREPVTHLTYTGPYAGHPLCGDKREGDNGVHAAYAPESFFEHGHVDERHGTKVCPDCQAMWNEPESHEPGSEQMSLFSSFREVTHSRHVAAGPIMDPRGGVPSGMNNREKAEFLKNQPWKATHTFEPIGWDAFDARPHPGSKPIAAGSPVMNHGQMSPRGPGGMTLWHVSDEQGNHQTVDKRSLKSLRKGKQSALDISWLDGFDAGRSLAQGGGQLPVRRLASLGLYGKGLLEGFQAFNRTGSFRKGAVIGNPGYRLERWLDANSGKPHAWAVAGLSSIAAILVESSTALGSAALSPGALADLKRSAALSAASLSGHTDPTSIEVAASAPWIARCSGSRGNGGASNTIGIDDLFAFANGVEGSSRTSRASGEGSVRTSATPPGTPGTSSIQLVLTTPTGRVGSQPGGATSISRLSGSQSETAFWNAMGIVARSVVPIETINDCMSIMSSGSRRADLPWIQTTAFRYVVDTIEQSMREGSLWKHAPMGPYKDFDACVKANSDKDDPEAYCGKIKHETEDKKESSLVTQASTPKEMLPLVRHFVNENYDGEYRTQYSGPHKSGGHLFVTTLHGPEGPVVHTHVDPDGTLTDLTRSPSGAPTEEQARWLKTHGSLQAEGARDWYSNNGNRVVLRAGDKRGLVHLHDWQSGEHMGHVQRSGTGYKAISDGGAHLGDFDDRDEAINTVFGNHLNNRYGGPEFGGPPKIASQGPRPFAPEAAGNDLNPNFDHGPVSVHYPPEDSADGSFTVHCQHCGPVSEHGDEDSAMVAAQEHNRLHPWNRSVRSSYTAAGPDNPYMPGAANPFVPNTGSPGGEDMQPSPTTGTMPDPGSAAVPDMDMGMVDPKTTRPRQKPSSNPNAPAMPATAPMGSGITQGFASLAARKAQEVARAVLATNPGLDPSQALRIAQATVERFPSMVRTSFSDSPELEHWQNDMAASQPQGDQGGGRGGLSMPSLPGIPGLGGGGAGAGGLAEEAAPLLAAANLLVTAAGIVDRIHGMDDGDRLNIGGNEKGEGGFGLSYYEYQPDGDNGQPAPGYLAGEYYLHHPSGKVENFHCSPGKKSGEFHAIQKRYQAEQISRRISDHIHGGGLGRQSGLHVAQQACPQCGAESYDPEVGICANCGYQGQAQSGGPGIGPYDPISANG